MMPSNNNYAAWVYGSLQRNAARFCSTERLQTQILCGGMSACGRFQPVKESLDITASTENRAQGRRSHLPAAQSAAVATARLPADEAIVATPFGDQSLEVEHGPALAGGAVRGELVIVLVQGAKSVERDHGCLSRKSVNLPKRSARPARLEVLVNEIGMHVALMRLACMLL